jgi:Flp pilus assembly protein TadD
MDRAPWDVTKVEQPAAQPDGRHADEYRRAAREALRSKDFVAAARHFLSLLELHPNDIATLTSLGYARQQLLMRRVLNRITC